MPSHILTFDIFIFIFKTIFFELVPIKQSAVKGKTKRRNADTYISQEWDLFGRVELQP